MLLVLVALDADLLSAVPGRMLQQNPFKSPSVLSETFSGVCMTLALFWRDVFTVPANSYMCRFKMRSC